MGGLAGTLESTLSLLLEPRGLTSGHGAPSDFLLDPRVVAPNGFGGFKTLFCFRNIQIIPTWMSV